MASASKKHAPSSSGAANRKYRGVIAGQPNTGKTHLVNALSGSALRVGNFPGVTIEKREADLRLDDYSLNLIDLPGIYALLDYSDEERITRHYLFEESYDFIINVVDATQLERNLQLTLQLLDLDRPMVVALNMSDEIREHGGKIDTELAERLLGVPVVCTSAKKASGLDELLEQIDGLLDQTANHRKSYYTHHIEEQITPLRNRIEQTTNHPMSRAIALRLLEGDSAMYRDITHRYPDADLDELLQRAQTALNKEYNDDIRTILFQDRADRARGIVRQITRKPHKNTLTDRIDRLLIHPLMGLPIFLFFIWLLFQLTFQVGSLPMDYIEAAFDSTGLWLSDVLPNTFLARALTEGIIPAVGAIFVFLPNILILFLGLNLLEQTGYMARSAFLLDGFLKRFGLQGHSFIPLVSGFGCSVPAYMAARTLKNPRDRIITMLIIGFMSCGARLPVYVLFVGAFFPPAIQGNVLFLIYVSGALLGLIVAKLLRKSLFGGQAEPFVMEMPRYQKPSLRLLWYDLYGKTRIFVKKAGTFIAMGAFVIWLLGNLPVQEVSPTPAAPANPGTALQSSPQSSTAVMNSAPQLDAEGQQLSNSYLGRFGRFIQPVFQPMGFDWQLSVSIITALVAKEIAVSTIAVLYHTPPDEHGNSPSLMQQLPQRVDIKTAIAFILIIMTYSPCFAAMSTFYAETPQWKWRTFYTIYPNVVAWLLAAGAYQLLSLLGF